MVPRTNQLWQRMGRMKGLVKYCNECNKLFDELCRWKYHSAIIKDCDAKEQVREARVQKTGVCDQQHRGEEGFW